MEEHNKNTSLSRAGQVARLQMDLLKRTVAIDVIDAFGTKDDHEKNTDFRVTMYGHTQPQVIAARYRKAKDWDQYVVGREQVTIRFRRSSGTPTEWSKMMAGHGDYLFFARLSEDEQRLTDWLVLDLSVLRSLIARGAELGLVLPERFDAVDDDGSYARFQPIPFREWAQIEPTLILATGGGL